MHHIVSRYEKCPASGCAVLRSKLVDARCQVQCPVEVVELAFRSFLWLLGCSKILGIFLHLKTYIYASNKYYRCFIYFPTYYVANM